MQVAASIATPIVFLYKWLCPTFLQARFSRLYEHLLAYFTKKGVRKIKISGDPAFATVTSELCVRLQEIAHDLGSSVVVEASQQAAETNEVTVKLVRGQAKEAKVQVLFRDQVEYEEELTLADITRGDAVTRVVGLERIVPGKEQDAGVIQLVFRPGERLPRMLEHLRNNVSLVERTEAETRLERIRRQFAAEFCKKRPQLQESDVSFVKMGLVVEELLRKPLFSDVLEFCEYVMQLDQIQSFLALWERYEPRELLVTHIVQKYEIARNLFVLGVFPPVQVIEMDEVATFFCRCWSMLQTRLLAKEQPFVSIMLLELEKPGVKVYAPQLDPDYEQK